MSVEMTAKRWLLLLALAALLIVGALAARSVLSISPPEQVSQIEEQHDGDGRTFQSSRVYLVDR